MSINKSEAKNLKSVATCITKIGKGNHEITGIVDIYKLNSDDYDFVKIRFMSGQSPFKIEDSSSERIYLDDSDYCKNNFKMFSGTGEAVQELTIHQLCLEVPSTDQDGRVILHCTLTNRNGYYPKYLEYTIANFKNDYANCESLQSDEPKPMPFTEYIGDDDRKIVVSTNLKVDTNQKSYNYAEINFTYEPTQLNTAYHQLNQPCITDPIYLYNQNLSEKEIYMYTHRYENKCHESILYIDQIIMTMPTTEKCGRIVLKGTYYRNEGRNLPINKILATWNLEDGPCE
ncbi:hypothetical protein [Bacillus cereus]|uniref:hypothetical protein n=1 Tax=Bacillus cereus TaxID=1396 RepID=UPI000BF76603|nr:hypothetical protein [Bacillus cereus]PET19468.1 hypothetical protein CN519_29340 [Bacillus cereus]PEU36431.1 hypothetical protein CN387_23885 [Bacillus cereus]PEY73876.1 hypothetical protein CN344_27220 [Bacillus cereus]PFI11182.1 hypothetical protein COI71_29425 [Bacillus cereus]PFS86308.1 hypothetical protein COK54_27485 [Bacillus cereus]